MAEETKTQTPFPPVPLPAPAGQADLKAAATTPAASAMPPATSAPAGITDEVKKYLTERAYVTGLTYTELEKKFTEVYAATKGDESVKKRVASWTINGLTAAYIDHPLVDYEIIVLGTTMVEHPKYTGSKIICGSYMPGIDAQDVLSPGKLGIPTIISNPAENYKVVERMQPLTFWKVNAEKSHSGEKRAVYSSPRSVFSQLNKIDTTEDQMMDCINKRYPVQSLASLKNNLSATIAAKKPGKEPVIDMLDLRQVEVYVTSARNGIKGDSKWYLYGVQDDSLTEDEKKETKVGDKTIYGGAAMGIPRHIYEKLNLDAGSVIRALVTVSKTTPKDGELQKSKVPIRLDAVAIFVQALVTKKIPQVQVPSAPGNTGVAAFRTAGFDLASQ